MQCIQSSMARDLNERDLEILRKLAPEIVEMERHGYQIEYLNILPPLANHHSRGLADFEARLKKLSADDFRYLVDVIFQGSESLSRLEPDYAEAFSTIAGQKLSSSEIADKLREAYDSEFNRA